MGVLLVRALVIGVYKLGPPILGNSHVELCPKLGWKHGIAA